MANSDAANRAAMDLQIAQFRLKQALRKDDGEMRAVSQQESSLFCDALNAVFQRDTPANVQVTTSRDI